MSLSTSKIAFLALLSTVSSFSTTKAFAQDNYFCHGENSEVKHLEDYPVDFLNDTYFNRAAYRTIYPLGLEYSAVAHAMVTPGAWKRVSVLKMEKSSNGKLYGPRNDLVLESKEKAEQFCKHLSQIGGNSDTEPVCTTDYNNKVRNAIAVAYWIAYGADSTLKEDGSSTRSKKYVICKNSLGVKLNPNASALGNVFGWDNENELTGVRESKYERGVYRVLCVNPKKNDNEKSTNFFAYGDGGMMANWQRNREGPLYTIPDVKDYSGPTLHQLNQYVGYNYCSN